MKKLISNVNKQHVLIGLAVILGSLVLDQVTKMLALIHLDSGGVTVIENFFSFKLYFNTGAAWSSFSGEMGMLMLMTAISIVVFSFFFLSIDFNKKTFYSIGISLMFGGLFGNMIDRLAMQKVVDFLAFEFGDYSFPIFNVADICLVVGVFCFLLDILFFESKRKEREKNESVQSN